MFNEYAKYYDLLNYNKNYISEVNTINKYINKYSINSKSIFEFGSGTGIHAEYLISLGYEVNGIEYSSSMLDLLNPDLKSKIKLGDLRFALPEKEYDVVLSLFHVISYMESNNDLNLAFSNANKHLKNGGLFIFDTWYGPAVLKNGLENRIKRIHKNDDLIIRFSESRLDENNNTVFVNFEIFIMDINHEKFKIIREEHKMRYYFVPELKKYGELNGFELLEYTAFPNSENLSTETWGSLFIFKKI